MGKSRIVGRTRSRAQALQIIFQAEAAGRSVEDVLNDTYMLSDGPLDAFGRQLAEGCGSQIPELDVIIQRYSRNWSLNRISSVDKNLLRLALYEILNEDTIDIPISIDECVELAKAFGTDDSSRFVNGILGSVASALESGEDLLGQAKVEVAAKCAVGEKAKTTETEQACGCDSDDSDMACGCSDDVCGCKDAESEVESGE